jgi:hypothetical protein
VIKKQKRAIITRKLFAQKHNKPHVKTLQKYDLLEKDPAKPENYSLLAKMTTSFSLTDKSSALCWRLVTL